MNRFPNHRLPGLLVAALLFVPAAWATPRAQVVDSDGTLLTLHAGAYGELFPGGSEASRGAEVLALDLAFEGSSADVRGPERLLVPGTDSAWPESSATLYYDAGAGVTYLLWSAPFNGLHPMLYLTTFDGTSWGEVIEIVGTLFAPKMDLQLSVGRDSYARRAPDQPAIERTVVHVAWLESRATGIEKQYAAVVLENGAYVGRTPSRPLASFLGAGEPQDDVVASSFDQGPLARALVLQPGANHALIAGYHDPQTGQMASLEIQVLPLALSLLADRIEAAARSWDPAGGASLMEVVDRQLAEHGAAFHPAVLALVGAEIQTMIEAALGGGEIEALPEKFGPRIIHIGMRVGSNGLVSPEAVGLLTVTPEVIDFVSPRHDIKITSLGRWAEPGDVGPQPYFMLSRDGGDALVAWRGDGADASRLLYRETQESGWSEVRGLELTDELPLERALSALADHLRDR